MGLSAAVGTDSTGLADSQTAELDAWEHKCQGCGVPHYCSARCLSAASSRPAGVECTAIAGLDMSTIEEDDRDTVLQAIRILADRANGLRFDVGPAGLQGPDSYAQRLVGLTPSTASARESLDRICAATLQALPPAVRVPRAELLDILERHSCNRAPHALERVRTNPRKNR